MLTPERAKEIIKPIAINAIILFAKRKLEGESNFQILDLLIPKERKIRSIVGGLETSLGTTLWEPLAKALAAENGFEVISQKLQSPVNTPGPLSNRLEDIISERVRRDNVYNAAQSHDEIREVCQVYLRRPIEAFEKAPRGTGVDFWLRKDGINYFFDTKTVQPNVGDLTKYMRQILTWYAYFYSRFPSENAQARIVFPYNPYQGDFWNNTKGKGFPLERDNEAWVENQFWDFCTGLENTFAIIQEAFREIRDSGDLEKDFASLFK